MAKSASLNVGCGMDGFGNGPPSGDETNCSGAISLAPFGADNAHDAIDKVCSVDTAEVVFPLSYTETNYIQGIYPFHGKLGLPMVYVLRYKYSD
jgi:hypothetical protein